MPSSDEADETSPLLQQASHRDNNEPQQEPVDLSDVYQHFCYLIGIKPVDAPPGTKFIPPEDSLYRRATQHRRTQNYTYAFTAALTNTLLLSQIVFGAALTGLGASSSSHALITVFGALNTVMAGVIAFLKSRGQPMRARMFRDQLDHVVDEIENSAVMWLGIARGYHGYEAIDTDGAVTVRGEVARLTRMYERAVLVSQLNEPDFYGSGGMSAPDQHGAALRDGTAKPVAAVAQPSPQAAGTAAVVPATPATADPDQSPATEAPAPTPAPTPAPAPAPTDDGSKATEGKGKGPEEPTAAGASDGTNGEIPKAP